MRAPLSLNPCQYVLISCFWDNRHLYRWYLIVILIYISLMISDAENLFMYLMASRQEYWGGLPYVLPGDLPNWGIKLMSLVSPALAGGFLTSGTTWGGPSLYILDVSFYLINSLQNIFSYSVGCLFIFSLM